MAGNRSQDSAARRKGEQAFAKIQHSSASEEKPKPKRAAVVADPRKRLVDGETDPDTKELKPAR